MSWAKMAEAFSIFAKYEKDIGATKETYVIKDLLFAGPSPEDVFNADKKRLMELGWLPSPEEDYDCFFKPIDRR
jgi:hypothetical protein